MNLKQFLCTTLALVCALNVASVLSASDTYDSDRYDTNKSFLEGRTYEEGFRRELYVQFQPNSPIQGCRTSGGGGGG